MWNAVERKERPSFGCETFLFVIFAPSLNSRFFPISTKPTINSHQTRTEPKKKEKQNHSKGYMSTTPFLPPSLIKTEKSSSPIPHPTNPIPIPIPITKKKIKKNKKKNKKKNSQPQLRLLIPPHIRLLSTPLTHLQTPPFALHDPCAETVMIGVVTGEMAMFDETATRVAAFEVDDFVLFLG